MLSCSNNKRTSRVICLGAKSLTIQDILQPVFSVSTNVRQLSNYTCFQWEYFMRTRPLSCEVTVRSTWEDDYLKHIGN